MATLILNNKPVEADLVEVPAEATTPPERNSDFNRPFYDEICIRLVNPPQSGPQFYVARLHSNTDLEGLKDGTAININIPEQREPLVGEVVWSQNESPTESHLIDNIQVDFGFRSPDGFNIITDLSPFGIKPKELERKILADLGLQKESYIDQKQWERAVSLLPEIQKNYGEQILDTFYTAKWTPGNTLEIKFFFSPVPQKMKPVVTSNSPILKPDKKEIDEEISSFFETPLTLAAIAEGLAKIQEYFKNHEKYFIDADTSGEIPVPKLATTFSPDGELQVHLHILPLPKKLAIQVMERNAQGEIVRELNLPPGSKLPVELPKTLNDPNMETMTAAFMEHYGKKGFLVTAVPAGLSEGSLSLILRLDPAPKEIVFAGEPAPSQDQLKEMFSPNGYISTLTIRNGVGALRQWYAGEGHFLPPNEPMARVNNGRLEVSAQPLKLKELKVIYVTKAPDDSPIENPMDPEHNVMKEFEQTSGGALLDMKALRRAIGRINAGYPMQVKWEEDDVVFQIHPETGEVSVTVKVNDISPAVAGNFRAAATNVEDKFENWGITGSAGGKLKLNSGVMPGGRIGYFKQGKNQIGSAGASLFLPWLNERGSSLYISAYGTVVMAGQDYNHVVGTAGMLDTPFWRHSQWGLLTGLKLEGIINPDEGYRHTWAKPDVGIRYNDFESLQARATTGPRMNDKRQFYWETTISALKKFVHTQRLHTDISLNAGWQAGQVPTDQRYRGLDIPVGYEGISMDSTTVYAGARGDLKYDVLDLPIVGKWQAGGGASVRALDLPDGPILEGGVGIMTSLLGLDFMLGPRARVSGKGLITDPFNFTVIYSKQF